MSAGTGYQFSLHMAVFVLSAVEAIRGQCQQIQQSVKHQHDNEQLLLQTLNSLYTRARAVEDECKGVKVDELEKVSPEQHPARMRIDKHQECELLLQAAELQEVKRAVTALSEISASHVLHRNVNGKVSIPASQRAENSPLAQGLPHFRSGDAVTDGKDIDSGQPFGTTEKGGTTGRCEYYVEEPESPEAKAHPERRDVDSGQIPFVQTSPTGDLGGTAFVEMPVTEAGHEKSSAQFVLRTLERKSLKPGLPGTTQLRLKEVYQIIDSTGNRRSQFKTKCGVEMHTLPPVFGWLCDSRCLQVCWRHACGK